MSHNQVRKAMLERYRASLSKPAREVEHCPGCMRRGTIERTADVMIVSDDYKVPVWRCRACGCEFGREEGER